MIERTNSVYHSVYSEPVSKKIIRKQGVSSVDAVEHDPEKNSGHQEEEAQENTEDEKRQGQEADHGSEEKGALNIIA